MSTTTTPSRSNIDTLEDAVRNLHILEKENVALRKENAKLQAAGSSRSSRSVGPRWRTPPANSTSPITPAISSSSSNSKRHASPRGQPSLPFQITAAPGNGTKSYMRPTQASQHRRSNQGTTARSNAGTQEIRSSPSTLSPPVKHNVKGNVADKGGSSQKHKGPQQTSLSAGGSKSSTTQPSFMHSTAASRNQRDWVQWEETRPQQLINPEQAASLERAGQQ